MLNNFRDLGAEALPFGRCFRSAALVALDRGEARHLREVGIRTVVDLRHPQEVAAHPTSVPDPIVVESLPLGFAERSYEERRRMERWSRLLDHLLRTETSEGRFERLRPVLDGMIEAAATRSAADAATGYWNICEVNGENIRRTFEVLAADGTTPVVVTCSRGNDRTGLVVALLLDVLGVGEPAIAADYARSNEALVANPPLPPANLERLCRAGIGLEDLRLLLGVDPGTIGIFLGQVRERYGSSASFLTGSLGVDRQVIERLRQRLLG